MNKDAQGNAVTGSAESIAALDRAFTDYNAWRGDPIAVLQEASNADPSFALGPIATAGMFLLGGIRGDNPAVIAALGAAEPLIDTATSRERRHLAAAKAWALGDFFRATEIWEDILVEHPRDVAALRFAHDAYFLLGQSQSIRDSIARVLPAWSDGDPAFGFLLGQYAFGLEEAGDLRRAEATARRAIDLNADDAWAIHALAHVFEMDSRQDEGIAFLRATRPGWSKGPSLAVHNGWHLALFLLEQGEFAEILAQYDRFIQPRIAGDAMLDLVDAAALLWRIELSGGAVCDRWRDLSGQLMTHADDHVFAFNDLHIAMAAARSGDPQHAARLRDSLDRYARDGAGDNHEITLDVGRRLVDGILAFAAGDYAQTIQSILPVRYQAIRIGGSHAQRDLLNQTLIVAAERAGRLDLAAALLRERAALRPTDLTRRNLARVAGQGQPGLPGQLS